MSVKVYRRREDSSSWTTAWILRPMMLFFLLYFISSLFLDGAKWGPWTITAAVSLTTEFKGCNPQISVEKQNLVTVFIYNPNPSNYVILPHCVCVWLPVWSVDKPAAIALARRSRPIHGELWCLQRSWAVQWCSGISQSDENGSQLPPPPQRRHHVVVRHGRYNTMPKEGDKKNKTKQNHEQFKKHNSNCPWSFCKWEQFRMVAAGRFQSAANWCNSLRPTGPSDNTGFLLRH